MYFRIDRQAQILQVEDDFAHMASVHDDGSLGFQFAYSVSQSKVVQRASTLVRVTVESRSISKKHTMGQTQRGRVDVRALINNLRSTMIDAKTAAEQQLKHIVAQRDSDITVGINNEIIPQLRSQVPITRIPSLTKSRLVLASAGSIKQGNNPQPVLHRVAFSALVPDLQQAMTSSAGVSPQALIHDMITRQGLDPTHVLNLTPRASSEVTTRGGLSNTKRAEERSTDPSSRLLNHYLFPPVHGSIPTTTDEIVDNDLVQVIQSVSSDEVTITLPIVIPAQRRWSEGSPVTQLYVTFELIDSTSNLPIDTVTKVLDVARHLRIFNTPKVPPKVRFAPSGQSGRVNLEIKQVDKGATEVHIYKKSFWISSPEVDSYTLIGTYLLSSRDQSLLVQVDMPHSSPALYRVVPVGQQSIQGFEYTNVAVRPTRYKPVKSVSLTAMQVDTGARLDIRRIPTNVVAVQFLRWNTTNHETVPTSVGTDVGFIDDSIRQADLLTTIDTTISPDNVYRYRVRLIYRDGLTAECGDAIVDFLRPAPGQVDTRVEDLFVSHDETPNVTFNITTRTVASDLDLIKQMLEKQGLAGYFTGDIENQRDQLESLIAHNVQRVDLTTGRREDFGILTAAQFDDGALRKKQAVKQLEYGHRYRYEVYPLLRAPETLFDDFVKTTTDVVTKKSYAYKPAKFRHPFTLRRGVMVSTSGARMRHAKDPMSYGVIGSIVTTEVSFDTDTAKVLDPTASTFDRFTNLITWGILGDIDQIDHFLIMKQVHGIRTVLGKAHTSFPNGSCQYIHCLRRHDVGVIQYVIMPIYNDYKLGPEGVTNSLIVEAR